MEQVPRPGPKSACYPPHVLIWPLPALGHVNSMLKLAELLSHAGIKITFLNSEHYHERLVRHSSDVFSRYMNLPGFQFKTITDGLPKDHPQTVDNFHELLNSLASVTPPLLKDMAGALYNLRWTYELCYRCCKTSWNSHYLFSYRQRLCLLGLFLHP